MDEQYSITAAPAFSFSVACGDLFTALATAQKEIVGAIKDASNPFFKSKYADLSSVWDACHGPLNANGICIIQLPASDPKNPDVVTVTTVLGHSSGQWISCSLSLRPTKADAQGMGSAISYARRYTMAAITGVSYIEDDDGNAASKPTFKPSTSKGFNAANHDGDPKTPKPDVVSQAKLDELVVWCKENKVERDTVRNTSNNLFGMPVSDLTHDQFSDLRLELDKLTNTSKFKVVTQ